MKHLIPILFLIIVGCKRQDYIATEYIGKIDNERIIYSAYQTGLDNYTIKFRSIIDSDTFKIFDFFINDALYSKENSFHFEFSNDSLKILTTFCTNSENYITENGNKIILLNGNSE